MLLTVRGDQQSAIRTYQPGSGVFLIPPRASEKTPISENLTDAIVAGMEGNEDQTMNAAQLFMNISDQHVSGHQMTKNKQALDVFSTGQFKALGAGSTDLGLNIDYSRTSGNSMTYDSTIAGNTFSKAARAAKQLILDSGSAGDVFFAIAGKSWLDLYRKDTELAEWGKSNPLVSYNEAQNVPVEFNNVDGMILKGSAHIDGDIESLWLFDYRPGTRYFDKEGGTSAPFVADNEILFGCLGDRRFSVIRGIKCLDGMGNPVVEAGEIVLDSFSEEDPVTEYIRSQSRHAFVPADVNTTVKITGTFA